MTIAALMMQFPEEPDHDLASMLWYAIEPLFESDPEQFVLLPHVGEEHETLSDIRQFIARRAVADDPSNVQRIDSVLKTATAMQPSARRDVLIGLAKGLEAIKRVEKPARWEALRNELADTERGVADQLSIKFQDVAVINRIKATALGQDAGVEQRRTAIESLADNRVDGTLGILARLLSDGTVRDMAIKSLSQYNDPAVPRLLLQKFHSFSAEEQQSAINTLIGSKSHAAALLNAVEAGTVAASTIRPAQAMTIYQLRDGKLRRQLTEHWGDVRSTPREKRDRIAHWKAVLGPDELANADLAKGARVYEQNCGKCHKLFGKGGDIGPDLTGSDRRNLDYILENVITPSAVVGKDFRMQTVVLKDARIVTGALREQTAAAVVVQTVEKRITIPRDEIDSIEKSGLSLMPEGQFDALPADSVRDLVAYLASEPE